MTKEPHIRLLKKNDLKSMPWKNGGGVTREVAISPAGAQMSELNFDWRVSIATVSSSGPFSQFPGFDRWLAVWAGEGLEVGAGVVRERGVPFHFAGEDSVEASPIGGSIQDFGVIYSRDKFEAQMSSHSLALEELFEVLGDAGDQFLLCTSGELRVKGFYLEPGDIIHASGEGAVRATALARSTFLLIRIKAR